jgi:peptide/nickel transport system substrate-binding protein
MLRKTLFNAAGLIIVFGMVLAACRPATPAPPTFSGTATITFTQQPDNLSPLYSTMWFSGITRDFWLKGLWSFDDNNQPVPEIAAEIPTAENGGVSADGKIVTVKLRDDVTWSDGEPLTADDFVFTYQMIVSDKNVVQSRYPYDEYVESVVAADPHTLVVNFNEPFAAWLTNIFSGSPSASQAVLPKHVLEPVFTAEGTLDNAEWNRAPSVGVGPFVFKEWETDSHIIFTANPKWIRPPKLEQIFIRIVPDDAAQEAAILAGDTDIGVFLSSDQIEKLESGGNVKVVAVSSGYDEGWFLNVNPDTAHPAMLDVNVRKAIALATDRFTIVKDLLNADINPVNVSFWDGTAPYGPHPELKPYAYDPAEAKRLLDEAGWTDSDGDGIRDKVISGQKVDLKLRYITNDRELRQNVQAVVAQQWSEVGIGAELVNYSSDVYWNGYNDDGPQAQGQYDIAEYSSVGSFPDPEASSGWLCDEISSADNPDGANWQGYCNEKMDQTLGQQAVTLDLNERIKLYHDIEKMMYDDVIYIGMWKDPDLWSLNQRLQGVKLSGAAPFWNVHEWAASQ